MAYESTADGQRSDERHESDEACNGLSAPVGVAQPISIAKAAVCGALLSGLVAFMQGLAALAAFGIRLDGVGFFTSWTMETLFAGRGVLALTLITIVGAGAGALMWSGGALVWNRYRGHSA